MKYIIDFYQELDTINLILFWGVIIVIILLLIFSIVLANKNRKLKELLLEKETDNPDDIPVITENHYHENNYININKTEDITDTTNKTIVTENKTSEVKNTSEEYISRVEHPSEKIIYEDKHIAKAEQPIPNKTFVAEEHVMEYHKEEPAKATTSTTYQKNVLREMSLNQTSPIGIVKKTSEEEKTLNNVKDLNSSLKQDGKATRSNYLDELSAKLKEADIERTDYELRQEEDAIISYQELIAKKNELETDEEEDVVISLDELIERNKEREKLYNITEEEENDEFINELKHFRRDL